MFLEDVPYPRDSEPEDGYDESVDIWSLAATVVEYYLQIEMRRVIGESWLHYYMTLSREARNKARSRPSDPILSLLAKMLDMNPLRRPTAGAGRHEMWTNPDVAIKLEDTTKVRKEADRSREDPYWDESGELDIRVPQPTEPRSEKTPKNSLFDESDDEGTIQPGDKEAEQ